jgi:hypothetical protein
LVFRSVTKVTGEGYKSTYNTVIQLNEGDVLILDGDRGYVKPVDSFVSIREAIEDLTNIEGVGG